MPCNGRTTAIDIISYTVHLEESMLWNIRDSWEDTAHSHARICYRDKRCMNSPYITFILMEILSQIIQDIVSNYSVTSIQMQVPWKHFNQGTNLSLIPKGPRHCASARRRIKRRRHNIYKDNYHCKPRVSDTKAVQASKFMKSQRREKIMC